MGDVARTVIITAEQDQFVSRVMAARKWKRSQVVRLALDKLRADPVVSLASNMTDTLVIQERTA